MAGSTGLKRASLEDAWDKTKASSNKTLRTVLREFEASARLVIAGGSLSSVSANSRSSGLSGYGPGQITPTEWCELWRELIDLYDSSNTWLTNCAQYGLDPAAAELSGFPEGLTPVLAPDPVTDDAIYAWMMSHLVAIYAAGSDYSRVRVGRGYFPQ